MIIAIDGLGVNGKSTLAKMLSEKLNYKNFNTGAIYRCIAFKIINENLNVNDISNTLYKIKNIDINFENDKVFLDGKDVTKQIRTEQISVYSTNTSDSVAVEAHKKISALVSDYDEALQIHGFYMNHKTKEIRFDLVIDIEAKNKREVLSKVSKRVEEMYPEYVVEVLMDYNFSDWGR